MLRAAAARGRARGGRERHPLAVEPHAGPRSGLDRIRFGPSARAAAGGYYGPGLSVAGGRHAMGAQQFAEGSMMLDMSRLTRVRSLDRAKGVVDVEAGIMWPALVDYLLKAQDGAGARQWGIAQKQTGADRLTIGGALAANVHGRGLKMKPFVGDVEWFVPHRRPRERAHVQPQRESRVVPSCGRRVRPVRPHRVSQAAARPRARRFGAWSTSG